MIISEYGLWIAIGTFYLIEHVKFGEENTFVLSVRSFDRYNVHIPTLNYTIMGKQLIFLPSMSAISSCFLSRFEARVNFRQNNALIRKWIGTLDNYLFAYRLVGLWATSCYLIAFPLAIFYVGFGISLITMLVIHFTNLTILGVILFFDRHYNRYYSKHKLLLLLEAFMSPGLLAAIGTRLSTALNMDQFEGATAVFSFLRHDDQKKVREILKEKLAEMVSMGEISIERMNGYILTLDGDRVVG